MMITISKGRQIPAQCLLRITSVFKKKHQVYIKDKHDMSGHDDNSQTTVYKNNSNKTDFDTYTKQRKYIGFGTRSAVSPLHRLNKILPDEYKVQHLDSSPVNQERVGESSNKNTQENFKIEKRSDFDSNEQRYKENDRDCERLGVQSKQEDYMELRKKLIVTKKHLSPTERLKSQLPDLFNPENK